MAGQAYRALAVYCLVALLLVTFLGLSMWALDLEVTTAVGGVLILVGMWIPAVARLVTVRTVDRGWKAPFPLKQWGRPRLWVILGPLLVVIAIYSAAYLAAVVAGIELAEPAWRGASLAVNLAFNAPLLILLGLFGGLGEELGWRGYLQPRLDQAGIRASLPIVIVVETLFHVPIFALAGYLESSSLLVTILLFLALKIAWVPMLAWGTYRLRSIWFAAMYHSIHNGFSQTLFPKALGAGEETVLGEAGIFPVACYLLAAGILVAVILARKQRWGEMARAAMER